ncbi:MAG: ELM1/GtrOC1 family putative glycosyltransferase [Verrucomicrobiota bacterium]|nr:ELM1/GtrOC1 family putative glycosyltransferase [Verrucomicrobiota bacterium]
MKTNNTQNDIKVWRLIDGKPGHEKQSLGLILALRKLHNITSEDIEINHSLLKGVLSYISGNFSPGHQIKNPDLIIGCGHRTHVSLLAAQRAFGGKTIVLMKPSLPYSLFDLCLIPKHDNPPKKENIISSYGSLNAMNLGMKKEKIPGSKAILIGGPSRHFNWNNEVVINQIEQIIDAEKKSGSKWMLSTSPRTPKGFLSMIKGRNLEGLLLHDSNQTPHGWLERKLHESEEAWVTPDSVSMIFEALTAGCKTGLLKLSSTKKDTQVTENLKSLVKDGFVLPVYDFLQGKPMPVANFPSQADICAKGILKRLT